MTFLDAGAPMITILPSPLLPAEAYAGLLDGLRAAGAATRLAEAGLGPGEGPEDLVRRWSAALTPGTVLLAHSNAGYLAPLVRDRMRPDVAAAPALPSSPESPPSAASGSPPPPIVFMDAALPPEQGAFTLAPAAFRTHLAALVDEQGRLPPWTRWWPRADLAQVIPGGLLEALDETCPELSLAYFDTPCTAPEAWAGQPNAYLAFGETYADELAFARGLAWPVRQRAGTHLAWLTDPRGVSAAVVGLHERLMPGTRS